MSSLLKMNQKFLSKSSWTIRGNGSSSNRQQQQQQQQQLSSSSSQQITPQSNGRFVHNHSRFGVNGEKAATIDVKRRPVMNSSGGGGQSRQSQSATVNGDNRGRHPVGGDRTAQQTPIRAGNFRSNRPQHPSNLVTNIELHHHDHHPHLTSSANFGQLKRTKGMSHSITDLRELKEKPPPKKNVYDDGEDGFQHEIFERRIDMYIAELEMDPLFHLGSTIRAIYDGDEQDRFMEKLDARIKNHDKDIERMCNCHYQGFVDCIHELLKVRPQAAALKDDIVQVNQELKNSSENIVRKAEDLIKYRRVLCNTKIAIEHLQECLPVLDTFSRLMNQMNEKKYYPALKTLEQFETLYLPKIKKYRFAQSMCSQVPKIRETIKNESVKDLKDFLESIRQSTSKIGEIALRTTALSHEATDYVKILQTQDSSWLEKVKPSSDGQTEEFVFGAEELSATDIVDFSPVYRCLHIFGCLGSREQFERYYRHQRKQQAKLIFQFVQSSNANFFAGESFRNYLFSVVGFFVIEDHLLNTSNGLVTKQYLAENWDEVIKSLVKNVHDHASECKDASQMIYLKSLLMVFCHTVHSYGYCTDDIIKLLGDLRQIYIDILQVNWMGTFEKIFESDNYHPLEIQDEDQFEKIFAGFPMFEMQSLRNIIGTAGKIEYPQKFPFSSMVINIYKAVREFIASAIQFSNDLNVTLTDTEDMVRSSTNLLLTKTLSDALQTLIKKSNLGLLQLIQMSINLNYLEEASIYLKLHITEQINLTTAESGNKMLDSNNVQNGADTDVNQVAQSPKVQPFMNSHAMNSEMSHTYLTELKGETMFAEARADAESQIYTQLQAKVEEFFDLANYDFMMTELTGKASPYILDLISFLRSTFEAFTNLPPRVAQTACISSSKFMSSKLMDILKDDNVKAFSQAFLEQYNLDLVQCEMYAGSEPVPNFNDGALSACFMELRQVMDLLTVDANWSTYFAEYGKNESRYLRVPPHTALTLLEKQIRGEQKKGMLSAFTKNERDKKNRNDMIVKKLKDLMTNNGNQ